MGGAISSTTTFSSSVLDIDLIGGEGGDATADLTTYYHISDISRCGCFTYSWSGETGRGRTLGGSKLLYEVILATTELARSLDRG